MQIDMKFLKQVFRYMCRLELFNIKVGNLPPSTLVYNYIDKEHQRKYVGQLTDFEEVLIESKCMGQALCILKNVKPLKVLEIWISFPCSNKDFVDLIRFLRD